ncbi:hypothetical protein Vid5_gp04 [Pantoea phage vB_PagS_Vid5]|uniref:Uncharacterized protein n=1 Tax=Pantoea phage vB_PagS_Vid5 TaxID=2099652 RepID=A0A2P1CKM6_9CAUD|nr:head scaffolding protein [Pantoea phage vB_PagS_Vid5]AVJ51759.1 hypothetical protein Vid5_gp04 [Pantoea phage vB_PagS_Vid5]
MRQDGLVHNLTHTGGKMKKQFQLSMLASIMSLGRMGDLELSYATQDDVPAEFASLYTEKDGKFVLTGVKNLVTQENITRLQGALEKERNDHKATKEKYAPLAGKDVNEVIATLDRIPELEAAANGAGNDSKKIDALVEAKIKTRLAPIERERDQLKTANGELVKKVETLDGRITADTIKSVVTKAALDAKVIPSALDEVIMYGERLLQVDEGGKVITKDGVGVTPGLDPTVWLTEMLAKKPHWLPGSNGGGAGGSNGGGGGTNPFSHAGWNMTEQMKLVRSNPARAEQFAKAAGVDIKNPQKPAAPSK